MTRLAPIAEPTTLQLLEQYNRLSEELDTIDWRTARASDLIELRRAVRREIQRRQTESEARS